MPSNINEKRTMGNLVFYLKKMKTKTIVTVEATNLEITEVIIPPEVTFWNGETHKVTHIAPEAFRSCHDLHTVKFPDTIQKIGNSAFCGCLSLRHIELPNSLTKINQNAFYYSGLENIVIPDSVTYIGNSAFAWSSNFKRVVLPNNLKALHKGIFNNCHALKEINIPDSLNKIDAWAFEYCENISHVQFNQALVDRPDANKIFKQLFDAGLRTREILLRIPTL